MERLCQVIIAPIEQERATEEAAQEAFLYNGDLVSLWVSDIWLPIMSLIGARDCLALRATCRSLRDIVGHSGFGILLIGYYFRRGLGTSYQYNEEIKDGPAVVGTAGGQDHGDGEAAVLGRHEMEEAVGLVVGVRAVAFPGAGQRAVRAQPRGGADRRLAGDRQASRQKQGARQRNGNVNELHGATPKAACRFLPSGKKGTSRPDPGMSIVRRAESPNAMNARKRRRLYFVLSLVVGRRGCGRSGDRGAAGQRAIFLQPDGRLRAARGARRGVSDRRDRREEIGSQRPGPGDRISW